jgi:hypothetical protein
MDNGSFWTALGAIGTCLAALVALLAYLRPRPGDRHRPGQPAVGPASPSPAARAATPPPAPAVPPSPGKRTLRGTAPDRRTPRELDLVRDGNEVNLHMHPPGKTGSYKITLRVEELRSAFATGRFTLEQPGTTRRLDFKYHTDDPEDIGPDEVRIQLGTTSNQWWMYASGRDLQEALEALNPAAP